MKFIVAFKVLSNCVFSGTTPLGVTGVSGRSSSHKKKRKASAISSQGSRVRQSPRLHPTTPRVSAVIVPVALESQLSPIEENNVALPSPDLLDGSQGSVVPGTELPPLPAVARARCMIPHLIIMTKGALLLVSTLLNRIHPQRQERTKKNHHWMCNWGNKPSLPSLRITVLVSLMANMT